MKQYSALRSWSSLPLFQRHSRWYHCFLFRGRHFISPHTRCQFVVVFSIQSSRRFLLAWECFASSEERQAYSGARLFSNRRILARICCQQSQLTTYVSSCPFLVCSLNTVATYMGSNTTRLEEYLFLKKHRLLTVPCLCLIPVVLQQHLS